MAPLTWYLDPLHPDKFNLTLDPCGNYLLGNLTINNDVTAFGTTFLHNTVIVGLLSRPANTSIYGYLNIGN